MMTKRLTRRGNSGSRISARAILVSGPVATRMSSPWMRARRRDEPVDRVRRRQPGPRRLGQFGIAEAACAMDDAGVARRIGERRSGAPGQTGTSARPARARDRARVLRVAAFEADVAADAGNPDDLRRPVARRDQAARRRRRCRCRRRRRAIPCAGAWKAFFVAPPAISVDRRVILAPRANRRQTARLRVHLGSL